MVSFEGLASVDPSLYREGFNVDSWLLSDTFSHDNDLLAKALHTTVTASHTLSPPPFFDSSAVTDHISSAHISDPVIVSGAKRKRNCLLTVSGDERKRRTRASKLSQTTFITADPTNFRQLVQQVTGGKYIDESSGGIFAPIVQPVPHRLVNRLPCGSSDRSTAVPTLNTLAFLSHHQENHMVGNSAKTNTTADAGGSAVESDNYPTFPTLESWKVT